MGKPVVGKAPWGERRGSGAVRLGTFRYAPASASVALISFCLAVAGCGPRTSADDFATVRIDFSKRITTLPESPAANPGRHLRLAIAGMTSPPTTLRYYQGLVDYLGRKLDSPLKISQRRTYAEINQLLASGELDLGFLCSGGYVRAGSALAGEILAVPVIHGKKTYRAYTIVHRDSPIRDFAGLRGHSFAFADPSSNTGWLYPVSKVTELKATPNSFFSQFSFTYGHDLSIRAVASKVSDAASVDSLVYDYLAEISPEVIANVRIIEQSPEFGMPPVVSSPKLRRSDKDRIRIVLLSMHQDAEGAHVLAKMSIDRFVREDARAYDSIRQLEQKAGRGHP